MDIIAIYSEMNYLELLPDDVMKINNRNDSQLIIKNFRKLTIKMTVN